MDEEWFGSDEEEEPMDEGYDSDRLSDISDWDEDPAAPSAPQDPIQLKNTRRLWAKLRGGPTDYRAKVRKVLYMMDVEGINLPMFLHLVCWGDDGCIKDEKIRYERTALMVSEELPGILSAMREPPRSSESRSHARRPAGAAKALNDFAVDTVSNLLDDELEQSTRLFRSPADGLSEAELNGFSIRDTAKQLAEPSGAPTLVRILRAAMDRQRRPRKRRRPGEERKTRKDFDAIVVMLVNTLQYTRSHNANAWTKPLTLYLKYKGASAKALDFMHTLGITMSHSWSVRAFRKISARALEQLREMVRVHPWRIGHDNLNLPFVAYSQRLNNQSHFDSGTVGSIFIKPSAPREPPLSAMELREAQREGRKQPLTAVDLARLDRDAAPRLHEWKVYYALRYLLDSPEFGLDTYTHRKDPILQAPPSLRQLPHGAEHVTKQWVLETLHLDESTYEGTDSIINSYLHMLDLDSDEDLRATSLDQVLVWIGDQLTVERMRGLANYRCEDRNSFERLDWILTSFGWFHLLMTYANSLHKQYFGTTSGRGLRHAFALLHRRGLQSAQIKGTFYHHLHEGIEHVAEARLLTAWHALTGAVKLSDLCDKTPADLKALAEELVLRYASNDALEDHDMLPDNQQDGLLRQSIMWNRDILPYLMLNDAIKRGDVGMMEGLLPHMFFRFSGSGNNKYAGEILELLQGLHREWSPSVSDYVRQHCWLVNMKGGARDFTPYDLAIEHTVKDVKVTLRPGGPYGSWEVMQQRSPAIPTLRTLGVHIEAEFPTVSRGVKHSAPSKDQDVKLLQQHYALSGIYANKQRILESDDNTTDYLMKGFDDGARKVLPGWVERRNAYMHASRQTWSDYANASAAGDSEPQSELSEVAPGCRNKGDSGGSGGGVNGAMAGST